MSGSKNHSIHPVPRSREKQRAKQTRHAQNKAARADLYREFQGANRWNNAGEWHSKLTGLSLGVGR